MNTKGLKKLAGIVWFLMLGMFAAQSADTLPGCHIRRGLPNIFSKLQQGGKVTIAYLGGSITEASKGWREQSASWLQQQYPKAKINAVNAGIGGTGSDLGVFRLRKQVLSQQPDLVFVEFAVNDFGKQPALIHQAMEGIVRQIRKENAATDICFVYTVNADMYPTLAAGNMPGSVIAMEAIASHYGISSVHMGLEVISLVKAGEMQFKGPKEAVNPASFSPDNVHPYPETGHRLYTKALTTALAVLAKDKTAKQPETYTPGKPFTKDNWEEAQMIPVAALQQKGQWQTVKDTGVWAKLARAPFGPLLCSNKPGASLTVTVTGKRVGLYDIVGPGCGQYAASVDGTDPVLYPRFDKYATYYRSQYFFVKPLSDGKHTITFTVSDAPLDKKAILLQRNNTVMDDESRFAANACYAGQLLLIGKVEDVKPAFHIMDMVHHNPGEALTSSAFTSPEYLQANGYNGQVINDFTFAHAALTFDRLDKRITPQGSPERAWVMEAAQKVRGNIRKAHEAGIKVYYFTDIIVLPKKLVSLYHKDICDAQGNISFEKPKTVEVHRAMLNELFDSFPDLDGLVIRTGETYLNNVPYHTGNNPITNAASSHIKLLNLLREEVCEKRNKLIFYRTWSFGGMHDNPDYYLNVTNKIATHPNLLFAIKHTKGDYHRTFDFNPTLGQGKHQQVIEVQCQREYEGKGAYPDYVMEGVINGFEEFSTIKPQPGFKSLSDIRNNPLFRGVWSWSRGGGWVGPYISNEFWCNLNAWVISRWAQNTQLTEEQVFNEYMKTKGISGTSARHFRELCVLSAKAVLRGHYSAVLPFEGSWAWWMRDEFLSGIDSTAGVNVISSEGSLFKAFNTLYSKGLLQQAVKEKYEAVALWQQIESLSRSIVMPDTADAHYIAVSSQYGLLLHRIIAEGWNIMAMGFTGDKTGNYNEKALAAAIRNYDNYWQQYQAFKQKEPASASLYKPYAFVYKGPDYHQQKGMDASVNRYRQKIITQSRNNAWHGSSK